MVILEHLRLYEESCLTRNLKVIIYLHIKILYLGTTKANSCETYYEILIIIVTYYIHVDIDRYSYCVTCDITNGVIHCHAVTAENICSDETSSVPE